MLATFAALADPTRLKIVDCLGACPRSVGDLCDTLSLGQPQASKHLRVLRDAGVVGVEARAQQRIYSLRGEALRELSDWLERYRDLWDERMDSLDQVIEELAHREEHAHGRRTKK